MMANNLLYISGYQPAIHPLSECLTAIKKNMEASCIIIGAGAAGLMAARELVKTGERVIVLEARPRIGGRIYTIPSEKFSGSVEAGGIYTRRTSAYIIAVGISRDKTPGDAGRDVQGLRTAS